LDNPFAVEGDQGSADAAVLPSMDPLVPEPAAAAQVASLPPSSEAPLLAPTSPSQRAGPPTSSGPTLEGDWQAEQTTSVSTGPIAGVLSFTRQGNRLSGVFRSSGQQLTLFDVQQADLTVSFSVVIPGTPYETVIYRGRLENNRLAMQGLGEKQGVYWLVATR
jgi:hypothetical protein